MNIGRAIMVFAVACGIQVNLTSGQEIAQTPYLQEPYSQPPISLAQYAQEQVVYSDESSTSRTCKDCIGEFSVGGWMQLGYHTYDLNALFNNHADRLNLHQLWIHVGKDANGDNGFDIGGRLDYVYGVDAQNTQAFGINNSHWDNSWDNGIYGYAAPQAYGELAYGKTSLKVGHFFTIIGYEVVTAPDNFFYSHAYTMVNSEPFTHTGALVTHNASEFVTTYGGYVTGWDSGFEDNGDACLAGASVVLTDFFTITYTGIYGRFNETGASLPGNAFPTNNSPERGQMHSIVASTDFGLFNHVLQIDRLDTNKSDGSFSRDTFGINNYLFFDVCDDITAGMRFEWYNLLCAPGDNCDIYALTFGLNMEATECIRVRPEVRWDWDVDRLPLGVLEINPMTGARRANQMTFGLDAILTF